MTGNGEAVGRFYSYALLIPAVLFMVAGFCPVQEGNYPNGAVLLDFNRFVPTPSDALPQDALDRWKYNSGLTGKKPFMRGNTGWFDEESYGPDGSVHTYFKLFRCTYNSDHMGYETYGYLEIDSRTAVIGNSLKIITTGGINASGAHGEKLNSKAEYFSLLDRGVDPFPKGNERVGHPYLYFLNSSSRANKIPLPQAVHMNRLSFYVKMPENLTDNAGSKKNSHPVKTMSIGPFNGTGGHWYHSVFNRGGGWTHVMIDGHPVHNNAFNSADKYPYPSRSIRDMDTAYFDTMYAVYLTFSPYSGIGVPPYFSWIDEIEFYHDPEPQNSETINSPAVSFNSRRRDFEIGFSDKYKNNKDSHSVYELRYAFAPITNENYGRAKYAVILGDSRFKGLDYHPKGRISKTSPYFQAVWAPFRLQAIDQKDLLPGKRLYFAVKDLSKRDYSLGTFDREGDTEIVAGTGGKRRIDLIKRIDYIIPKR